MKNINRKIKVNYTAKTKKKCTADQIKKNKKINRIELRGLLLGTAEILLVVGLLFCCGRKEKSSMDPQQESAQVESVMETSQTEYMTDMMTENDRIQEAEMTSEESISEENETSETAEEGLTLESGDTLSKEEEKLLSSLYSALVAKAYMGAARILNDNEAAFQVLVEEILGENVYCYYEEKTDDGEKIQKIEKLPAFGTVRGLVLTRYNTAFCGTFTDGKPEGEVCAVQTMILDEPRYTFADGMWSDGKMNGEGKTGYHYYMNAPKGGFIYTEKAGTYRDNQLDGTFIYRTENGAGEVLSWKIQAVNGVTVFTEEWVQDPLTNDYMLASQESAERAYMLTEERSSALLWNNLIIWSN